MKLAQFDLSQKVALITGGAGLLGKQHAMALAECGAKVIVADLNLDAATAVATQLEKTGAKAMAVRLDVSNLESVKAAAEDVAKRFGDVNVLVNNAAIDAKVTATGMANHSRFEHFPLDQWQLQLDVGLTGAFLCSQVFGTRMAQNKSGVILNIASDLSVIAPDQRIYRKEGLTDAQQPAKPITYSVIKTALIGLTRYLAAYWAAQGVRVNAISPGGVQTDQPEEFLRKISELIPLGRMAKADEYRAAVQFLCSDASSYMTGQNLVMDGGRSII